MIPEYSNPTESFQQRSQPAQSYPSSAWPTYEPPAPLVEMSDSSPPPFLYYDLAASGIPDVEMTPLDLHPIGHDNQAARGNIQAQGGAGHAIPPRCAVWTKSETDRRKPDRSSYPWHTNPPTMMTSSPQGDTLNMTRASRTGCPFR